MRNSILVTAALAFFAGSLRAQLAQPPSGVTEGAVATVTNRCPANPELGISTPRPRGPDGAEQATPAFKLKLPPA